MRKKQKEEKDKPPASEPVPEKRKEEPPKAKPVANPLAPVGGRQGAFDPGMSNFREQQKELIGAIRKPNVDEVSAFDDAYSGAAFRSAEDPYEGKSFAEVLKMKREKLEKELADKVPQKAPEEEKK